MAAVQLNAPEIIAKLLEAHKRLIKFLLGCKCTAHGCGAWLLAWVSSSTNTFAFLPDTTQMQCILPELLPAQTRNRCSAVSVPTAKVQGGEGEALPVEPRKTQRTHTHATSGQSQVYAALASHCLMTVVSSRMGYTSVPSATSSNVWNKPAI